MVPLTLAFIYTWAKDHPDTPVTLYFFQIKAKMLPMFMMGIAAITEGKRGLFISATGIVAAHLYYYFDYEYPVIRGGGRYISTPQWLKRLLHQEQSGSQHSRAQHHIGTNAGSGPSLIPPLTPFQGKGHRLGS